MEDKLIRNEQEAIETIKSNYPTSGYYMLREALDMAVSALEKQIAKTPDYEGDGYADGELVYDTWICPNCGEYYEVGYDCQDYCPKCGQHIKHEEWERE